MRVILFCVLLVCLLASGVQAQSSLYCRQYTLTDNVEYVSFGEPVCYVSKVQIQIKSGHRLSIITDSLTLHFVIIHRQRSVYSDTDRMLASIVGEPEKIYAIDSHTNKANQFFMNCVPIRWNERAGRINGVALEISNVEICDKN